MPAIAFEYPDEIAAIADGIASFIKAEVIRWEDLVALGSEAKCRDAGKLAIVGKDYVVKDGDVMHFRFNV